MPKIRGVKPDYWTDEDIVELSIPARLLFIGLWTYACDNGHLQDKSKQIKMRVLPGDDVNAAELLRELEAKGRIARKKGWITIPNFARHQKPDKRYWQTCELADCHRPEGDSPAETRGGHVETTPSPRVGSSGPLGDGDVIVRGSEGDRPRKTRATKLPDDWAPSEKHWEKRHDAIDVQREAEKFRLHAEANDRRQVSWNAAFSQWLLNARPTPTTSTRPASGEGPDDWMRR